jgi:hypothetical protein
MFKTQNLYQNDERWKNVKLGNSSETIGGWGCLLTSGRLFHPKPCAIHLAERRLPRYAAL